LARRISQRVFRDGVIVETCGAYGEVLKIMPPLTITEDGLADGLTRISDAMMLEIDRSLPSMVG
jgi:diaminobutyrate-2-oxoglutarate transaminase